MSALCQAWSSGSPPSWKIRSSGKACKLPLYWSPSPGARPATHDIIFTWHFTRKTKYVCLCLLLTFGLNQLDNTFWCSRLRIRNSDQAHQAHVEPLKMQFTSVGHTSYLRCTHQHSQKPLRMNRSSRRPSSSSRWLAQSMSPKWTSYHNLIHMSGKVAHSNTPYSQAILEFLRFCHTKSLRKLR